MLIRKWTLVLMSRNKAAFFFFLKIKIGSTSGRHQLSAVNVSKSFYTQIIYRIHIKIPLISTVLQKNLTPLNIFVFYMGQFIYSIYTIISYSHMFFVPFIVLFVLLGLHLDGLTLLFGSGCFSCFSICIKKLVHVNTSHVFFPSNV